MATGKCIKCGKNVTLGIDGSCKHCDAEICWECWVAAGHECPNCGDFDGKRDTANSVNHMTSVGTKPTSGVKQESKGGDV